MIELVWSQGEHKFDLSSLGSMRALQQACDASPVLVADRLKKYWNVNDIYEVLRLGLIGGGMEAQEARELAAKAWDETDKFSLQETAFAVIAAAFVTDINGEKPPGE